MDVAGAYLHDDRAGALAILDDQVEYEPLLVHAHSGPHNLLVQNMEKRLSGEVGDEERAGFALPSKGARAQATLFVAAEGDAVVLHLDHLGARLAAHHLDGVLVAEVVGSLDGVVGVVAPGRLRRVRARR